YPSESRQDTETVALRTVKSLTAPGDGLCAAQGSNWDPPSIHLRVTAAPMGSGQVKLGAPVREAGPCLSQSVRRDGRRSPKEAGPLFVRVSAGRNKGAALSAVGAGAFPHPASPASSEASWLETPSGGVEKHRVSVDLSLQAVRQSQSKLYLALTAAAFFHPGAYADRDAPPYGNQTDYRIFELNKRLQNWTEECDNLWWDAFTTEFFEDDAMLTITFCLEDGPKRYTIGRTLIPRYFRSIFEGGATELYYVLKHPKESFHNNFVSLDCDQCTMVTQNGKPMFTQVCVEGRLYLEFMFDDMMRIKTWHFSIRQHRELIPRSILAMHAQDPQMLDQLSKNITRCGLSNSTLNYLRLCVILEPMQELMSRHKTYSLSPRDCLKTCLFQKWQRMVAPPAEPSRQAPNKRRKRKMSGGSTISGGGGTNNNNNNKKKSPGSGFPLSSQVPDVMVVGEPTLMGGEFGDEDERLITRLENTQFDAANGIDDEDSFNNSPALGSNSPWNNKAPSSQESKSDNPTSQASHHERNSNSPSSAHQSRHHCRAQIHHTQFGQ
ncbi:LIM domain-binding protein 1 isoform X3, partial [Lates japonicus]